MSRLHGGCPSRETLSAFFDGEAGAPWRGAIEAHVGGCARCQAALAGYRRLRQILASDGLPPLPELPLPLPTAPRQRVPLWRRRVALPLPAVAAAALAVLALGLGMALVASRTRLPWMSIKRGPAGTTELKVTAPVDELEQLLRALNRQTSSHEIVIHLPAESQLILMGQPQLMREADFSRGRKW